MFSDNVLEKILSREDVSKVPLVYQSAMIHAIQEVLEEEKDVSDAESEYDVSHDARDSAKHSTINTLLTA